MKGAAVLVVTKDVMDAWSELGPSVRLNAQDVARDAGGVLTGDEPTFEAMDTNPDTFRVQFAMERV